MGNVLHHPHHPWDWIESGLHEVAWSHLLWHAMLLAAVLLILFAGSRYRLEPTAGEVTPTFDRPTGDFMTPIEREEFLRLPAGDGRLDLQVPMAPDRYAS